MICRRVRASTGFTIIELMVVVAIIAIGTAGVSMAFRDGSQTQAERDAQRLVALLESARAQSRNLGVPVRWLPVPDGFRFEGVAEGSLPHTWLNPGTQASVEQALVLGPEPLIGPQTVALRNGDQRVTISTDGLRPFIIQTP